MLLSNWPSTDVQLRHSYTTSILEQFVLSHSFADVLRELAQNEYDAGGRRLAVIFGEESLQVTGDGKPIDAKGWRRLSVTLGTGVEYGTDRRIEEKVNGLGSKNFGLRALFLFGNRIFIRSAGHWTILDAERGTPERPLADPESRNRAGVFIEVPYRTAVLGKLEPFETDREEPAFASIIQDLALTVLKLDQPGASKRLREIVVTSVRQNRQITWKVSASRLPTRATGVTALWRVVRMYDVFPSRSHARPVTLEELEFQKSFAVPAHFRGRQVPTYYRVSGGRIRIGLSFVMKRKRIELEHHGHFFYPLGALQACTGTAVSVSAPFEMNSDRSQIVSLDHSDWNAWLVQQTAYLTTELLVEDWFERVCADAFVAIGEERPQFASAYSKAVMERLTTERVWPARVTTGKRTRRPEFKRAAEVTFPVRPEFDGILSDKYSLDLRLAHDRRVRTVAEHLGIPLFTANSLVRLRCAGKDQSALATKIRPNGEANYHYPSFPNPLRDAQRQVRLSCALDAAAPDLTTANRQDLCSTPTTLTAENTLAPASTLWTVDPHLGDACPVPPAQRLHPDLLQFRIVANLCQDFNVQDWARGVAERSACGQATDAEREALYRYLTSPDRKLSQKTWNYLRRFPILRDHREEWVAPAVSTLPKARGAALLEAALHYPSEAYSHDQELAKQFRFRSRIIEEDVYRYAEIVSQHPVLAEGFEAALVKLKQLLNPALISRLKQIVFLRSSKGGVATPQSLYIRTRHLEQCLGPAAPYAAGRNTSLYKVLGCQQQPSTANILDYLVTLYAVQLAPPYAEVLYPALASAIARDKMPSKQYQDKPILWNGSGYSAPTETLVGAFQNRFLSAVPQVSSLPLAVMRAYIALGAQREPKPEHSVRLLLWVADRYSDGVTIVTPQERHALQQAYQTLCDLDTVPQTAHCLLDRDGRLHSRSEIAAGLYLINDDPRTAQACLQQGVSIAFADTSDRSLRFFQGIGVRRLSTARKLMGFSTGAMKPPAAELRVQTLLARLHSPDLASAITALIRWEHSEQNPPDEGQLRSRLQALREIIVAEELQLHYQIAGHDVRVPADAVFDFDEQRVVISGGRSVLQVCGVLAYPLAELVTDTPQEQKAVADAIYRLLTESTSKGMQRYLESRAVPWKPIECREEEQRADTITDVEELEAEHEEVRTRLGAALIESLGDNPPPDVSDAPPGQGGTTGDGKVGTSPAIPQPSPDPLPPIDSVVIREADLSSSWSPSTDQKPGTQRARYWTTSRRSEERDRVIGDRAEELIFRREQERVRHLGFPIERVIWVARVYPNADHDIQSVDDGGETCWIEVKATTGQDGRFQWPKAEFERALHARNRYLLVRVYQADTISPVVKVFRDPVGLFLRNGIRLDTATLWGEVEPLNPKASSACLAATGALSAL